MRAKLAAVIKRIKPALRASAVCDALLFGGVASVVVGLGQVYAPLAWLAVGAAMILLAFKFAQTIAREKEDSR